MSDEGDQGYFDLRERQQKRERALLPGLEFPSARHRRSDAMKPTLPWKALQTKKHNYL